MANKDFNITKVSGGVVTVGLCSLRRLQLLYIHLKIQATTTLWSLATTGSHFFPPIHYSAQQIIHIRYPRVKQSSTHCNKTIILDNNNNNNG